METENEKRDGEKGGGEYGLEAKTLENYWHDWAGTILSMA